MTRLPILALLGLLLPAFGAGPPPDEIISVIEDATIYWQKGQPEIMDPDGFVSRFAGHTAEGTVQLPSLPKDAKDMRGITARVSVEPAQTVIQGQPRPNDPWTRLGTLSIVDPKLPSRETEAMRFITPFGGPAVYEQDITPLAPLLSGKTTIRVFIATYAEEAAWKVSVSLVYRGSKIGQRRPRLARMVLNDLHVTAADPIRRLRLTIPPGLDSPRVHVTSTGHATDGAPGNEFVSCTHILRLDGREIARWRPWSEVGGEVRSSNPWAGRASVEGREIWSSDWDRAGWHPGRLVEPLRIPIPELTPGEHLLELEIVGIRPKDPADPETGKEHHGYWVVSAIVVADEPWPAP